MIRTKIFPLLFLLASLPVLSGCGGMGKLFSSQQIVTAKEAVDFPYHLRPGDELDISVRNQERLNSLVQVREEGTFPFLPVGEIQAAGRSLREVEIEIQKGLENYYAEIETEQSEIPNMPKRILSPKDIPSQVYRLRPGDELETTVWKHDDLNQTGQVREDGILSFPLIGDVQASGRSIREVEQEIRERLNEDYIVNPQVTVRLLGAKFTVLGEVESAGSFVSSGAVDLLAALSSAGGTTAQGPVQINIIRELEKERAVIQIDLESILQGRESRVDIMPHDMIYVKVVAPEGPQVKARLVGAQYTVLGEVGSPGSYEIEDQVDLLTAVSQASGITKFGSNSIEIIRGKEEGRVVIRVDINRVIQGKEPNVAIQPHDTIYIKRRLI